MNEPKRLKELMDNAYNYLPRLTDEYRNMATDFDIPLVDAHDIQLADMDTLPQPGTPVEGYRFYRVNEHERLSGITSQYIADGMETSEFGLHFWFSEARARAYMLSQLKSDIEHKRGGNHDYLLERVNGVFKGVSPDEGFLMDEISPQREEVFRVTKNDIESIKRLN